MTASFAGNKLVLTSDGGTAGTFKGASIEVTTAGKSGSKGTGAQLGLVADTTTDANQAISVLEQGSITLTSITNDITIAGTNVAYGGFDSTSGNATAVASAVQDQIWAIDPNVSVSQVAAMEQVVSRQTWQPRISALLLGSLGLLALALAAVGLYGVLSYAVSRRTQEIGVRIAIGATPSDILWSTVAEGMGLTLAGLVLGLAASRVIARPLGGLLFEIEPDDPVTFGVQSVVLALVAFVACYLPARRATKVDPAQALRE